MNFNIVHILVIVFISGVIGLDNTELHDFDPPVINGKNASDVPAVTTVNSANITVTPAIPPQPPTPTPPPTPTDPPTTPPTAPTTTSTEKPTTTVAPNPEPTTTPTPAPPANVTTTTESTTTATTTTTAAPAHKGRHFDGPSFIGGIILASGLMAIGFVSWKFYKARTERNYHTL